MLAIFKSLILFPAILIPGWAYLRARGARWAAGVYLIGFSIILTFALTRWIVNPSLFILMNGLLVSLYLVTTLHGMLLQESSSAHNGRHLTTKTVCLIALFIALVTATHVNKSRLFGFNLYHVPSESMLPALIPGDIILVDTWRNVSSLEPGQIIVFKRAARSIVLVKRLNKLRQNDMGTEMYMLGDNASHSIDSRRFGWVTTDHFIGVSQGVVTNIR